MLVCVWGVGLTNKALSSSGGKVEVGKVAAGKFAAGKTGKTGKATAGEAGKASVRKLGKASSARVVAGSLGLQNVFKLAFLARCQLDWGSCSFFIYLNTQYSYAQPSWSYEEPPGNPCRFKRTSS